MSSLFKSPDTDRQRPAEPALNKWLLAVVAAFVAMGARATMEPLLEDRLPFILAFPAIVMVALRHGALPALVTVTLCALWAVLPVVPPTLSRTSLPLELGAFVVASFVTAALCVQFRHRAEHSAAPHGGPETAATRLLRAVLWGAAIIPLTAFAAACWWGHAKAFEEADVNVAAANAVVADHAMQTIATAQAVTDRVAAATARSDDELRANEAEVHERLKDIAAGAPLAFAITVVDASGHALASNRVFPVDRAISLADRDYFKHFRESDARGIYVSEVVTGRLSGQQAFNVAAARPRRDGAFDGVIAVTILPTYFQDFYRALASKDPGLTSFSLFKTDGALLTRWPAPGGTTTRVPEQSPLLARARAGDQRGRTFIHSSFDTERRLMSFQRIGDMPLYVTAGLSEKTILAGWYRFVQLLAAIVLPTTAGLVYVSWIALQRTQRAGAVLHELQQEMHRRTQAEQALIQSQKLEALGQLTGGVAHDFNNLLAIVSNNIHVVKHRYPALADAPQLAAIARATASGVKLTRQLLSFARKHAIKPEIVSLQTWLPGAADLLRTTVGSRVEVQVEVEHDAASIEVDPAELELALINLTVNAKDAMPDGGVLRIRAGNVPGSDPAMVSLRVGDTGTGIPADVLPKVFEPFYTTKPPGKGSGLGLSQVYGLCLQAGGTVEVETAVGKGTTVHLLFPARASEATKHEVATSGAKKRISGSVLLVEDNDELARTQLDLLRSFGLAVARASNADAALAMAERAGATFDAVLTDIVMPGSMNGVQLAFRLREIRPRLPVILSTGYAGMVGEATNAGFAVLQKPTPPDALFAELVRAMQAGRTSDTETNERT